MINNFEQKLRQAEEGKRAFSRIFKLDELSADDTFLLILTDNEESLYSGVTYLPDFIEQYQRRYVYVLSDNEQYIERFTKAGGTAKLCTSAEMKDIAAYFSMFRENDLTEIRMIFLTEKDGYGLAVEELLEKREFSIEEYVAISLYQLGNLKECQKGREIFGLE